MSTIKKFDITPIVEELDKEIRILSKYISPSLLKDNPLQIMCPQDAPDAQAYFKIKEKFFNKYGARVVKHYYSDAINTNNPWMIQAPSKKLTKVHRYSSYCDVDGLTATSIGYCAGMNVYGYIPPTVQSILAIMKKHFGSEEDIRGKRVLIVGKSNIIGKPLALCLMNMGAIVTIYGKDNEDPIVEMQGYNDCVVLCTGKYGTFKQDHRIFENKEQLIIDAGITFDRNGKMRGELDLDKVSSRNITYTPVPKGVGTLTVRFLLINYFKSLLNNNTH